MLCHNGEGIWKPFPAPAPQCQGLGMLVPGWLAAQQVTVGLFIQYSSRTALGILPSPEPPFR